MSATRRLAEFIHDLNYDGVSEDAIAKAKLCVMDWVAVAGYVDGRSDM